MFKIKSKMQNEKQTAGETAKERTLVIFRDCHAANNIVIQLVDSYEERFYRNFARRMGWPCCIRNARTEKRIRQMEKQQRNGQQPQWRKPDSISARRKAIHERQIASAFDLRVRTSTMEGGWA